MGDRPPARRARRAQAQLGARRRSHGGGHRRRGRSRLLGGHPPHLPARRDHASAAAVGLRAAHRRSLDEPRVDPHADVRHRHALRRLPRALRAFQPARGLRPGLHSHRARQGTGRARRGEQARGARGRHPGGDGDRPRLGPVHGRLVHRRVRLRRAWPRPDGRGRHLRQGLSGDPDHADGRRRQRAARESRRGRRVRFPRSAGPRAMSAGDAVAPVGLRALARALAGHRLALVGLVVVVAVTLMAVLAPLLAPYDPYKQNLYQVLQPPSAAHWLGTDNVGRDLLSRVIYGARVSLLVGVTATVVSALAGVVIGLVAGYLGGAVDNVVMRVTDAFMCFPYLIFVLALAAALGPGVTNIVAASITIGLAILTESGTAFLGLGAEPPTASWGKELRIGYTYLERVPLFSLAPGVMITLTVLAFNFLGDGLRDALDPRLRGDRRR